VIHEDAAEANSFMLTGLAQEVGRSGRGDLGQIGPNSNHSFLVRQGFCPVLFLACVGLAPKQPSTGTKSILRFIFLFFYEATLKALAVICAPGDDAIKLLGADFARVY